VFVLLYIKPYKLLYMKQIITLSFVVCFFVSTALAQREYNTCDSTFYTYVGDTTIVAGKRHLYFQTGSGLTQFANFTSTDTSEYIRDFDIVQPDLWYTLVGLRYIGSPTRLYKSRDRGVIWVEDTSFYVATRYHPTSAHDYYNSINQLQYLGNNTIVLLVGYYESGLVYSTDNGATWKEWFRNLISHYHGFLECNNKYYLYGFEGDAFRPWMFGFDKSLLFSPDTSGAWDMTRELYHPQCSGLANPNCIYAEPNINRCGQYSYMKNYIDSMCTALSVPEITEHDGTRVYPNPSNGRFEVVVKEGRVKEIRVHDMLGRDMKAGVSTLGAGKRVVELHNTTKGMYVVLISNTDGTVITRRILVK
jgi:hypothetical protein